jgi:hypothetical protein
MNNRHLQCRAVGINRRTGTLWRYGRTVTTATGQPKIYPPISQPARPVSGRYLSEDERIVIADQLRAGRSVRAIAAQLNRAPSTVSRAISRNGDPVTGDYHPFAAHQRATARRPRPKPAKLLVNAELRDLVQDQLDRRWSPEQICNVLRTAAGCPATARRCCAPAGPIANAAALPSSGQRGSATQ